jgi:ribose transport system permease protein
MKTRESGVESVAAEPTATRRGRSWARAQDLGTWGPILFFIGLVVVFGIREPDTFLTMVNLKSILNDQAVLLIAACGLTVVLLCGEFDLSIAGIISISGALGAGLIAKQGLPIFVAIAVAILVGVATGAVSGILVTAFEIPSLIATLAIATILDGITLWYTNGETISQGVPDSFSRLGRDGIEGLAIPFLVGIAFAALLWFALRYTATGRFLHAIGGNREAARVSGIRVSRHVILAFMVSGGAAALAGVLLAARNASATPSAGLSFLLPAFAATFLGAATLRRGQFHIVGTFIGVYLIATGTTGLFLIGSPSWIQSVFSGAILILATAGARFLGRRA